MLKSCFCYTFPANVTIVKKIQFNMLYLSIKLVHVKNVELSPHNNTTMHQ